MPSTETSRWTRSRPKRTPSGSSEPRYDSASSGVQVIGGDQRTLGDRIAPPADCASLITQLLQLRAVGRQLLAFGVHDVRRGVAHEAVVVEPLLSAVDLGAQLLAPLRHPAPHLRRVDLARGEDLHRAEAG